MGVSDILQMRWLIDYHPTGFPASTVTCSDLPASGYCAVPVLSSEEITNIRYSELYFEPMHLDKFAVGILKISKFSSALKCKKIYTLHIIQHVTNLLSVHVNKTKSDFITTNFI